MNAHPSETDPMAVLAACLPANLRSSDTKIARISAGLSGAGVYRIEAADGGFVLKISGPDENPVTWRSRVRVRQLAAEAGVAPRVVHVDEARRAVVSVFVADRSFPSFYANPSTREVAVEKLGRMLRRVHDLPLSSDAPEENPREGLARVWTKIERTDFPLPAFASDAIRRVLAESEPVHSRTPVLSHNDVNPSNLLYDGENVLLLDWEAAGANDPLYDLAAIALFLRMDDTICRRLLSAHEGAPMTELPAGFDYRRRLVAVLCGGTMLKLAREKGHAGASGGETLESTPGLAEIYGRLRSGALHLATSHGQWQFGLALLQASLTL